MTRAEGERLAKLEAIVGTVAADVADMKQTLTELRDASLLHQGASRAHQNLSARRAAVIAALTSLVGGGITTLVVRLVH